MPAAVPSESRPFQVHLGGVVELLGRSIYSTPHAYLRELVQNGVDALHARRDHDGGGSRVLVTPVAPGRDRLTVEDDGIGLSAAEVTDLLATVGRSGKRDVLDLPRTDRLGQFGIGLLSCFMVSDEIHVVSRSALGDPAVQWVGRADGTFSVRPADDPDVPVGTRVTLTPRPGARHLLETSTVRELARRYGEHLAVPVDVAVAAGAGSGASGLERVNRPAVFAQGQGRQDPEVWAYGRELLGAAPLDVIDLHAPGTGTRGTAFVLPRAGQPGTRPVVRTYLRGMLVGDRVPDLLPDWAFFVRAVVDTSGLHPTASREGLVADDAFEHTRDELAAGLRRWLLRLAAEDPHRLELFLDMHALALRSLVLDDDELARLVLPHLSVHTSIGSVRLADLAARSRRVLVAPSHGDFQQVAALARPDEPVVDGGYLHDAELVFRMAELATDLEAEEVEARDLLTTLAEPPPHDRTRAARLEDRARGALLDVGSDAVVRDFHPADVPALHLDDADALRRQDRSATQALAGSFWAGVLGRLDELDEDPDEGSLASGLLCLNWANPLVRTLADLDDDLVRDRTLRILHVQALLAGHRPLRPADRAALTTALDDVVRLSVATTPPPQEDR